MSQRRNLVGGGKLEILRGRYEVIVRGVRNGAIVYGGFAITELPAIADLCHFVRADATVSEVRANGRRAHPATRLSPTLPIFVGVENVGGLTRYIVIFVPGARMLEIIEMVGL